MRAQGWGRVAAITSVSVRQPIPGLILSRLFLGAGEGTVFTAGSAWNVDMAPEERRGRMIGLYGLAIWTGLTLGPPIGVVLQDIGGFNLVWALATAAPQDSNDQRRHGDGHPAVEEAILRTDRRLRRRLGPRAGGRGYSHLSPPGAQKSR